MTTTTNLQLTLLEQAQAQKEVTVNNALVKIDALLNAGALSSSENTPPSTPNSGDVYIIGASPTGAWAGKAKQITYFDQIWRFIEPNTGSIMWAEDVRQLMVYRLSGWQAITVAL
jgi:hypothetical protein